MTNLELIDEINYVKCKLAYLGATGGSIISEHEDGEKGLGFTLNMEAVINHLNDLTLKINQGKTK